MKKIECFSQERLASYIDRAVLEPQLTNNQLREQMMIGVHYGYKSVCVNPSAIDIAITDGEVNTAVNCCIEGHADFIKTSTGYLKSDNLQGTSPDHIKLILKTAQMKINVKGSGYVRTRERLIELIQLGIDHAGVGCFSTAGILGSCND